MRHAHLTPPVAKTPASRSANPWPILAPVSWRLYLRSAVLCSHCCNSLPANILSFPQTLTASQDRDCHPATRQPVPAKQPANATTLRQQGNTHTLAESVHPCITEAGQCRQAHPKAQAGATTGALVRLLYFFTLTVCFRSSGTGQAGRKGRREGREGGWLAGWINTVCLLEHPSVPAEVQGSVGRDAWLAEFFQESQRL